MSYLRKYQLGGNNYDLNRAVKLGYKPDSTGHLPSRDFETGKILKSPYHPTFKTGLQDDAKMGYRGFMGSDGKVYTQNPSDLPRKGIFAPKYQLGGDPYNSQYTSWGTNDYTGPLNPPDTYNMADYGSPSPGVMGMDAAAVMPASSTELTGATSFMDSGLGSYKSAQKPSATNIAGSALSAGTGIAQGVKNVSDINNKISPDAFNAAERREYEEIQKGLADSQITTATGSTVASVGSFIPVVGPFISLAGSLTATGGGIGSAVWADKEKDLYTRHQTRLQKDESRRQGAERASSLVGEGSGDQFYGMSYAKNGGLMKYQNGGSRLASESDVRSGSRNFLSPTSAFTEQGTRIINKYPDSPNDTSYMYMNPSTNYFYNTGQNAPGGRPVQNFSGAESTPDNSYYQSKVKELAKYQTGGKISTMRGVPKEKANALLEGNGKNDTHNGELVLRPGGKVMAVKGPRHSEGHTPVVLQPGDRVLSDYTEHPVTGKTIAETYEDALKRGAPEAELESIWNTQEMISSSAPEQGMEQGMEQTAKTGGLMKYQLGTPGPIPGITPRFNMFEDRPMGTGSVVTMKGMPVSSEVAARAQGKTTVSPTQKKPAPKKFEYELMPPLRMDKDGNPIMARDSSAEAFVPNFKRMLKLDKEAKLPSTLPMAYTPAPTTSGLKPTKEKGKLSNLVKYAPELGLLAMGAIEAAMVPSEYDLPEVPATPQISVDKVFLDRSRAGELARARGAAEFRTSIDAARASGMGPGAMSYMQREQNAIRNAVEDATINAEKLNLAQSAEEKRLNLGAEVDTKKFNAEMKRMYDALGIARGTSLADFKIQRRNAIAEALKSGVVGAANTYSSQRLGDAYAGNTGVMDRFTVKQLEDLLAKKKEQENYG